MKLLSFKKSGFLLIFSTIVIVWGSYLLIDRVILLQNGICVDAKIISFHKEATYDSKKPNKMIYQLEYKTLAHKPIQVNVSPTFDWYFEGNKNVPICYNPHNPREYTINHWGEFALSIFLLFGGFAGIYLWNMLRDDL